MNSQEIVANTLREPGIFCEGCPFVRTALNAAYYLDTHTSIANFSRADRLRRFEDWTEYRNQEDIVHDVQHLASEFVALALQQSCQGYVKDIHNNDFEREFIAPEISDSVSLACELSVRHERQIVQPWIAEFIKNYQSNNDT